MMKSTCLTLILFQVLQASIETSDIQLTPLKNPILPVELGTAKLIYNKHIFLHYVDLDLLISQLKSINKHFLVIRAYLKQHNVTNPISYHGLSEGIISRAEYLVQVTQNKLNNLYPHISRNKRGLVNVIGTVNKWLFSTLDADDGNRYDNAIKNLENNQKNILTELNSQISLSKNLIDNYNKTISILHKNQNKLEKSLEVLYAGLQNTISNITDYISFQGIIYQINLDCQNLINFIDNLEDAFMFAKLNVLHSSKISSSELKEMLNYLKEVYNFQEIPNFNNILSYYLLLGAQISFSNRRLIFSVHVLIVRPENLALYHIFPVVQKHKLFIPKYPYLARAEERTQFSENSCPLLEELYYCTEDFRNQDRCTLQLLQGSQLDDCQVLHINTEEPISEQITQDKILILPMTEEKLFSKCSSDQHLFITTPTLVKIPKNCHIKIRNKMFINDLRISQGKPLVLPEIETKRLENLVTYQTPNLTELNFEQIYRLKDMANKLSPVKPIDEATEKSPLFFWITIIYLVTALCVLIAWRRRSRINMAKTCCRKKPLHQHHTGSNDLNYQMTSVILSS